MKKFKRILRITALSLAFCVLLAAISIRLLNREEDERLFLGAAKRDYDSLRAAGFPDDYASALTELRLLHPEWYFVPLNISEINPAYTWDHVIDAETENPETNLIYPDAQYRAYRASGGKTYDSGYYSASRRTVSFFMDPRNFLNEADIFQFYDLTANEHDAENAVRAVLAGSFMENAVLENDMTYAEYFAFLGKELNLNPVYLALKVYQEQGVGGTSPIISGRCGDELVKLSDIGEDTDELRALNGYYNFFNLGAGGSGLFNIYRNAMEYAETGTESMASEWGSPSWDTRWKSLYGGALTIRQLYIERYQSTIYLQKFNVDDRSGRAFWGQYMQNVAGAMNEARLLYRAFADCSLLDLPCTFLIPVYDGMPKTVSTDPGNGKTPLASAVDRYDFGITVTSPVTASAENRTLYQEISATVGKSLTFEIDTFHSYDVKSLEINLQTDGSVRTWTASGGKTTVEIAGDDLSTSGTHILTVRGIADFDSGTTRKNNATFLCAVFYINIK